MLVQVVLILDQMIRGSRRLLAALESKFSFQESSENRIANLFKKDDHYRTRNTVNNKHAQL